MHKTFLRLSQRTRYALASAAGTVVFAECYYKSNESSRLDKLARGLRALIEENAPSRFDYDECLLCAKIIDAGFEADHVTEATVAKAASNLDKMGLTNSRFFYNPRSNAHGFVVTNENVCIVAFRGSREAKDFHQDSKINFASIDESLDKNVKAHEGFRECCISIQEDAIRFMKEVNPRKLPLIITGHSLGGANAVLAAYMATVYPDKSHDDTHYSIKAMYTYGQPRVGNHHFHEDFKRRGKLDEKLIRVVNKGDVITRMPPFLSGYRHNGHELFFDEWGIPWWNLHDFYKIRVVIHDFRAQLIQGKVSFLENHFMENYLSLLMDNNNKK